MEPAFIVDALRKTLKMDLPQFATLVEMDIERVRHLDSTAEKPTPDELKQIMERITERYRTPQRLDTLEEVYASLLEQIAETLAGNMDKLAHNYLPQFEIYIGALYREARNAILLGMPTAALTTLCVLLEYVIKDLIQDAQEAAKGSPLSLKEEKEIERWMFGMAVTKAREANIIVAEEEAHLREIGEWMRNPLMHSKLLKSTEDDHAPAVPVVSMETGEVSTAALHGKDDRFFRKITRLERDKGNAWPFFLWVESFIAKKYALIIEKARKGELGGVVMMD